MKTITLTLALGAVLALSAALPAAAGGNNGGRGDEGFPFDRNMCETAGGVWFEWPGQPLTCIFVDGELVCDSDGYNCEWNPLSGNVNRGPQAPATAGVATAPESPQRGFQIQQAPTTAGVATAPQSPRRGFQVQPMFPAVGTFRIR